MDKGALKTELKLDEVMVAGQWFKDEVSSLMGDRVSNTVFGFHGMLTITTPLPDAEEHLKTLEEFGGKITDPATVQKITNLIVPPPPPGTPVGGTRNP